MWPGAVLFVSARPLVAEFRSEPSILYRFGAKSMSQQLLVMPRQDFAAIGDASTSVGDASTAIGDVSTGFGNGSTAILI